MESAGIQFGPYELKHRLGVGGMAETFVALRHGPGGFQQKVCIKRILPAFEEDPNFVRLFLREARLSAHIRHSNVAQVVDFGMVDNAQSAYGRVNDIKAANVDLIFCNMLTYATSATWGIMARELTAPIVMVALQPRKAMDYDNASTYMQLVNDKV